MKFENTSISTSIYLNNDKSEAHVNFWPSNIEGVESAQLHFKTKKEDGSHCEPEPYKITYTKSVLNTGTKINIEVASNGFIVKIGSITQIADTEYVLKSIIDIAVNDVSEHEIDYNEDEHDFSNLAETTISVTEELSRT